MANIQELLQLNFGSMTKPDLLKHGKALQTALKDINDRTKNLDNNIGPGMENVLLRLQLIETKQTESTSELEKLKKENTSLKRRVRELEEIVDESNEETEQRFVDLETAVTRCEQYTRRENFEISGIPADLPDKDLEGKVLSIINAVTERPEENLIVAKDIHACHRLKKEDHEQNPKVIVRMVNRKDTFSILQNKKTLADKAGELNCDTLYISENLCNDNKDLLEVARKLKKKGKINSCWTFNGVVHIKLKQTDKYGKKIFHMSEYEKFFSPKDLGWE